MRSFARRLQMLAALTVSCGLAACSADDGGLGEIGDDASSPVDGAAPKNDATAADTGAHSDGGIGGGEAGADATIDGALGTDASDASDTSVVDASDASALDVNVPDTNLPDTNAPDVNVPDAALPPAGSTCSQVNAIQSQPCGMCGTQERVCLPDTAGGQAVWQPWGFCQNEPAGACTPGEQGSEACGFCGHRARVCQNDCSWAVGACLGQPDNACTPGTTKFQFGLSCQAGAGRTETCQNDCSWGAFGACTAPSYGSPLAISATVGETVTGVYTISDSPSHARIDTGECPATLTNGNNAYTYVLVQNNTDQAAKVSIYFSKAPNGEDIDTEIAIYPGAALPPLTDSARLQCLGFASFSFMDVNDSCYVEDDTVHPDECLLGWGGLVADDGDGDSSVPIAAHSSVWVYAGAVEELTSDLPHAGNFQINLRTESLQ